MGFGLDLATMLVSWSPSEKQIIRRTVDFDAKALLEAHPNGK